VPDGVQIDEAHEPSEDLLGAVRSLVAQLSKSAAVPSDADLSDPDLSDLLASSTSRLLMARGEDQQILGMLTLVLFRIPTGVRAWIEDVVVLETARGRSVGGLLVRRSVEIARDAGARTVDLTSRPDREAANALYVRQGFKLRESNVYRITI
jgi:ribosomal protein S18 acetylase RimI-like enzyme